MGMDYRYLLFFERDARVNVLERLAGMAEVDLDRQTLLVLADRILALPFESWLQTDARLRWDDPSPTWDFMTVLSFEPDDAITDYLDRMHRAARLDGSRELDAQGRAGIGIIYLRIVNDMTTWADGTDTAVVLFDFGTPGSSMSVLFTESDSIRSTFVKLLSEDRGVCGILDHEDWADLYWWRGREVSVSLPTAELSMSDIESFVTSAA